MSYGICVNPNKLESFMHNISQTPMMINNVSSENNKLIDSTHLKIDNTIDMLEKKIIIVKEKIEYLKNELRFALINDDNEKDDNIDELRYQIKIAEEKYNVLSNAFNETKKIKIDYLNSSEQYRQEFNNFFQSYNSLLNRGCTAVENYLLLVRDSVDTLSAG